MSHYVRLYSGNNNNIQAGFGLSDIQVYRGPLYRQHGAGIGHFFNKAVRYLKPLLFSGVNAITDQGLKSASSVLSQLGKKDLKTILNEESQKAVRNLSDRAIEKIKRSSGQISPQGQAGSGMMPIGLSDLQLKRLTKVKKKPIKATTRKASNQTVRRRKIGQTSRHISNRKQIGAGRVKKSKSTRKSQPKKRKLDIFA